MGSDVQWLELSCRVDREAAEPVGELFARYGRGVALEDVGLTEGDEQATAAPCVTIRTYLPADEAADESRRAIERGLWVLGLIRPVGPLETRTLAEADWAEAWKAHFYVHRVGRRVVIKPSWRAYAPSADDVVIELDPGMAFGTGLHPTTQLCLQELEERVRPGNRVLDLGTGSGILAIAAARLGASRVLALDTDAVAVAVARANIEANGLAETIAAKQGTLPLPGSGRTFDVVVANIIARVIADLAVSLAEVLAPAGTLIASGILLQREQEVATALYAAGLRAVGRRQDGDWLALVAQR